ncbi:Rpn family recombination-promoting nuclease/putative transposase [Microcystis aeruginosa]|nr:Rpn family recombination-promoting nuclease/putative transposase [Microcystis aeruginosa]
MKTDTIFYRLFQTFPDLLFELIDFPRELANFYRFSSVEVKQLSFRIDGVFLPERQDLPIYFTEVQFQNDPEFYARFFAEIFLYLKQTQLKNNWRGVVIYPNRRVEKENIERYRELLQETRVQRIYLEELAESPPDSLGLATLELVSLPEAQVINQVRELIVRVRETGVENRQQELLELIETILIYKLPQINRKEIEAMFSLSELRQTRVFQEALEEGRQEGEIIGKLASVPLLLRAGVNPQEIAASLGLSLEQVLELARSREACAKRSLEDSER